MPRLLHITIIALLGLLAYSNTFDVPFVYDDTNFIVRNPFMKDFDYFVDSSKVDFESERHYLTRNLPRLFKTRLVGYFTLWANYRLGGLNVTGYHALNLTLHIINALFAYLIVLLTFRTPVLENSSLKGHSNLIALFSGLLFVAHPMQTEAVTYILQRLVLLSSMFYLGSTAAYIGSRLSNGKARYGLYALALIFAVLGMKTKENVFTLPVAIGLYEFLFFRNGIKKRSLLLVPLLLTMLIIPLERIDLSSDASLAATIDSAMRQPDSPPRLDYLFTQFNVITKYIRLLIFPLGQNIDHNQTLYHSFFEPSVFLSFLFLLSIFGLGLYLFYRSRITDHVSRLAAFGIFWFFISISVESSVLPIGEMMVEYRVYLPSTGIFFAFVTIGFVLFNRMVVRSIQRTAVIALTLMIIALSGATYARNAVWQSEISLWEDVVNKSPRKARGYNNLGLAYMSKGLNNMAIAQFLASLELDPKNYRAHNNLGNIFFSTGKIDKAIEQYEAALKLNTNSLIACTNLANAYFNKGLIDKALEYYIIALRLKPNFAETHNNLGNIYKAKGLRDKAIGHYKKALMLKPEYAEAHNNIAVIYGSKGQIDRAVEHLREAIKIKPNYAEAYNNMALLFGVMGQTDKTIEYLQRALRLRPDYAEAHYNLGLTYITSGHEEKARREFKAALSLNPDLRKARTQLERIGEK
jgi:tetratricopeptide (TPR) repeat protein